MKNRESRNKPMHIWPTNLPNRCQEYNMGKGQSLLSGNSGGKARYPHAKE